MRPGCQGAGTLVTANSEMVRQRFPRLARILDVLSRDPGIRTDLVEEIQARIRKGEYLTEEKLNLAIHRLLKEILGS